MKRLLLAPLFFTLYASAQMVPWLTRGGDNVHSGWNSQETILTQQSITTKGVSLQPPIPVIGDARGMEAQPLILPKVTLADGSVHDVMLLPSMADVVRGVDAHSGAGLWQTTLATPVQGNGTIDIYSTNDHWGCQATGVIDPDTHLAYLPCEASPDNSGNPQTSRFFMYVLDLASGKLVAPPVEFQGSMTVNGQGSPQDFNAQMRKLRAGAVMLIQNGKKTVILCGGSVYMTQPGVTGFCSAFDVATNKFMDLEAITQGRAGNVWMSGGAPAVLPDGSIVFVTATGGFDGVTQFGESVIRMTYDGQKLHFVDHFTPYTDRVRTGQDQQSSLATAAGKQAQANMAGTADMVSGANPSTNSFGNSSGEQNVPVNGDATAGHAMAMPNLQGSQFKAKVDPQGKLVTLVYPPIASGTWADEDLGSAQQTCIAELNLCIVAGKDGIAYSVRSNNMGNTSLSDLTNPKTNCAKLAAYPIFATAWTGEDACPANPEDLNFLVNGDTVHEHFPPVPMYDPLLKSWTIFFWGENEQLKKYSIGPTGQLTFVAQTQEFASSDMRAQPGGGMTGGGCAGSSNGDLEHGGDPNSALLACSIPYGDANKTITNGRLLIYDPIHTNGGVIHALWDSQTWGIPYLFNKFMPPFIDGGEIILPDFGGRVLLFQ